MSFITLAEAKKMISGYGEQRQEILIQGVSTNVLPLSITFSKSEVLELLDQTGSDKLRVYFGSHVDQESDKNDLITVILVAADQAGDDIIPTEDYLIIDHGDRCPMTCPPSSPLTS